MYFIPFKGSAYDAGYRDGHKLLVLAESHYVREMTDTSGWPNPGYTCGAVEDGLAYRPATGYRLDFWGRLHRVLSGVDDPTEAQARAAWSRIAYSNYIQRPVGTQASSPKNAKHWQSGRDALPEILARTQPNRVLILGKGTWNNVWLGQWLAPQWTTGAFDRGLWGLPVNQRLVPATWVMHPSWGREDVGTMRQVLGALMDSAAVALPVC